MFLLLPWTYAVFVLHTAVGAELAVWNVGPPLIVTALLVTVGLLKDDRAILLAAVWGFLADALSAGPLGVELVTFPLATLLLLYWRRVFTVKSSVVGALLVGLLAGAETGVATAIRELSSTQVTHWPLVGMQAAISLLYALPLAFVMLWCCQRLRSVSVWREVPASAANVSNSWRMLTN